MSPLRVLTQNVMGLRKQAKNINTWFCHWKSKVDIGSVDVVYLQETHVVSAEEATRLQTMWDKVWEMTNQLLLTSFWSVTEEKRGGVAILVNPYSDHKFTAVEQFGSES